MGQLQKWLMLLVFLVGKSNFSILILYQPALQEMAMSWHPLVVETFGTNIGMHIGFNCLKKKKKKTYSTFQKCELPTLVNIVYTGTQVPLLLLALVKWP